MPPPADLERPRMRFVEPVPVRHDGQIFILFRDPQGIATEDLGVPLHVYQIIANMTGEHTLDDLSRLFLGEFGEPMPPEKIRTLVQRLDESHLLDSPRFHRRREEMLSAYRQATVRPMRHAGGGYPLSAEKFQATLNALFVERDGPEGFPKPGKAETPRALVAPHIDFPRGGPNYAAAYRALGNGEAPETVVILGVSHAPCRQPFTLTRNAFDTPLGPIPVERAFIDAWAERLDFDPHEDELNHLGEHSAEFQAVWLRHLFPAAEEMRIVPVLCGPMNGEVEDVTHRSDSFRRAVDALVDIIGGWERRVTVIAGSDFAHVGPQFGDDALVDAAMLAEIERQDREALDLAAAGDAEGFVASFGPTQNARRVCSVANTATLLHTLPALGAAGDGRLLGYVQSASETGDLCVTHASLSFF